MRIRKLGLVALPYFILSAYAGTTPAVTVSVAPARVDLSGGGRQQFTAIVAGTSNTAVDWSITPASAGTISTTGLYVAPVTVASDMTISVTAAVRAVPGKTSSTVVQLHSNKGIYFTTQANGLQSVMFNGVDYNYKYGEALVTYLIYKTPNGMSPTSAPTCSGTFDANSVTKRCFVGADSANVVVSYSLSSANTLQANIQITNNSPTNTITNSMISTIGMQMAQFNAAASRTLLVDSINPISYGNFVAGQWLLWNNQPSPDSNASVTCGWSYTCKNQIHITDIAPNQTKSASFSLRFSTEAKPPNQLAPEAYTAFRNAYPPVVNWPDRRPIMAWFIADYSKRSATNPRGYLQQAALDVSNISNFKTQVLGQAQRILTLMQARPVQPQGLLVWDLEGQEFIQPTTYIGDPRVLSQGYAPEMDSVADQVFTLFKSAGYKVGVTIRPQQMQWGTQLPTSCQYNASHDYKDYYIKVDNPFGQRFFACYDPAGVKWSVIPQGNGGQTFYTPGSDSSVTALLMSKVAYAHSRWGATLFYIDTAVWSGGAPISATVISALQQAFPDSLFIPEQSNLPTMGAGMPYSDPKNTSAPDFAPVTWRYVYPNGAMGVYLSNCTGTCWTSSQSGFEIGQKIGDIAMYTQPTQMSAGQLTGIESMIQKARSDASLVTVTDSSTGSTYAYRGFPDTVYKYPVKMRVYFAASAAQMGASTTFCEGGGPLGEMACSLNLSKLVTAQIRYYDFAGAQVSADAPRPR